VLQWRQLVRGWARQQDSEYSERMNEALNSGDTQERRDCEAELEAAQGVAGRIEALLAHSRAGLQLHDAANRRQEASDWAAKGSRMAVDARRGAAAAQCLFSGAREHLVCVRFSRLKKDSLDIEHSDWFAVSPDFQLVLAAWYTLAHFADYMTHFASRVAEAREGERARQQARLDALCAKFNDCAACLALLTRRHAEARARHACACQLEAP